MAKQRWDMYGWVGNGDIKIREGNVSLKEAQRAKEKWKAKSPKHEAFIALHEDKKKLKPLLKPMSKLINEQQKKSKKKSKGKSKKK